MSEQPGSRLGGDKLVWIFFSALLWLATFFVVLVTNAGEGLVLLISSLLLLALFLGLRRRRRGSS